MLPDALRVAVSYADENDIEIPFKERLKARRLGAIKAGEDLPSISSLYHDEIISALVSYFEGGSLVSSRNAFKRATVDAFGAAFDLGWTDGGRPMPPDEDALAWFNARIEAEFGYITMLFQEAKELKQDSDFDSFAWSTARAAGYTNTLREVYNAAHLRAIKDRMVTFSGDDGVESCDTCKSLKGKRHKISWFVKRNFVPPFGTGLQCHRGGHCQHYLEDDGGISVTV